MEHPYIRGVRLYQHLGTVRKLFRQLFLSTSKFSKITSQRGVGHVTCHISEGGLTCDMSHLRGGGLTCDIWGPKNEIFKIGPKLKVWTSGVDFWLTFEVKLRKKNSTSPPAGCLGALGAWLGPLGGLSDFRGRGPKKSKKKWKNQPKVKKNRFFKIGPNVKIWVSGVQFRPKKAFLSAKNKILKMCANSCPGPGRRLAGGT